MGERQKRKLEKEERTRSRIDASDSVDLAWGRRQQEEKDRENRRVECKEKERRTPRRIGMSQC